MAKGNSLEFYSVSEEETIEWVEALKTSVILLDLKEEFNIGRLLGKGNSARVHLCERKSNINKYYALKTVHKSFLKKSE